MPMNVPEVLPEPINPPKIQAFATPETFGGGAGLERIGQQEQQIGQAGGEIASFEKIRADQAAVEEAYSAKFAPQMTQLIYGNNLQPTDPKYDPGAIGKIHQATSMDDIHKIHDDYLSQAKKLANETSSNLVGQTQFGPFNRQALQSIDTLDKTLMAHGDQKFKELDTNAFNSGIENTTAQDSLNWSMHKLDPTYLPKQIDNLKTSIDQYAFRNGIGPEEKENLTSKVLSNYHAAAIEQMLSEKQDTIAQDYFKEHGDQITEPKVRDHVQKSLEEGMLQGDSSRQAQSIISKFPNSESDALKQANKIQDSNVSERTRALISRQFQQDRQAQRNDQDNTFMNVAQRIKQSGLSDPVDIAQAITPGERALIRDDQYRALLKTGQDVVTSPSKWLDFMETVKDGSVTKMSRADLETKYLPYMDSSDKKQAENLWTTGKRGKADPTFIHAQSIPQMIDADLVRQGYLHGKENMRNEPEKEFQKQFHDDINRSLVDLQVSENRKATPEEIQGIIDKRLIEEIGNRPTSFFTGVGRRVGLSAAPIVKFGDIPDDARDGIINQARKMGKAVTKEQVEAAYSAFQRKDIDGAKRALQ